MAKTKYLASPPNLTGMPPGVPYIIGNEGAERFSFYGMRTILIGFMTQFMVNQSGVLEGMPANEAQGWFHQFVSSVYWMPFFGAIIADGWIGKYKTIFSLSIVYCLGQFTLALMDTSFGVQFGQKWVLAIGLMLVATIIFWLGRKKMVHIPPAGLGFLRDLKSKEGLSVLARVWTIFAFTMIFWALWDQSSGGEWTIQCQKMDLHFLGISFLPEQVNVVNGLFILAMIPLFNYWLYPAIDRVFPLTPVRKIGIGLFLTALSFLVIWWIQLEIAHGGRPNAGWQFLAYFILSAGEVMVSITGLEFAYTQAPNRMKSLLMAMWLLSIALGNQLPSVISFLIPKLKSMGMNLEGANYFRFFTLLMLGASVIYIFVARVYRERTFLQSQQPTPGLIETGPLLA